MAQGTAVESSVPLADPDPAVIADDPAGELYAEPNTELAPDPAIEARAREMGWKPLAEYRGPADKWQPAADFIARGETILPIVRDQNRRLTERLNKLEGEVSGLRNTAAEQLQIIKDLRTMGQRADQRGYDRAMAEIKAKQRQAVEQGDTKAYDQLVEQAEALAGSRAEPAVPVIEPVRTEPASRPAAPQMSEPTRLFIAANPWFNTDKLLSDTMIAFHQEVLNEHQATQDTLNADPALDRELLDEARRRVVDRYPERFGTPRETPPPRRTPQRRAPTVTPPSPPEPSRNPNITATIASIPDPAERAEAKTAFERLKRQLPDITEAEYMALWNDPHSDVLEQQQKRRSQPNGR